MSPHLHVAPDDVWICAEIASPDVVPENDHRGRANLLIRWDQRTPDQSGRTRDVESRRGHLGPEHALGTPVTEKILGSGTVCAQVLDSLEFFAPDAKVIRKARLWRSRSNVPVRGGNETMTVAEREDRMEKVRQKDKRRHPKCDCESQSEPTDNGDARILDQHPETKLEVEQGHSRQTLLPHEWCRLASVGARRVVPRNAGLASRTQRRAGLASPEMKDSNTAVRARITQMPLEGAPHIFTMQHAYVARIS
jgi:hypothetical protein